MDADLSCGRRSDPLSPIITLTTDFGTSDGYVAQMKGVILSIKPDAALVDVTHEVEPFSILEGALVLKGVSRFYGQGTIHVAVVDPGVGGSRRGIVVMADGRFYVGPDNGLFSLILASATSSETREIRNADLTLPDPHPTFHGRDVFAPIAAHLAAGASFRVVGPPVEDPVILAIDRPRMLEDGLEGEVIHIDRFGSLTTNIEAGMLSEPVDTVEMGTARILGLSTFFDQVPEKEALALINSFGFLEIAVNRGNASQQFGIRRGAKVRVHFKCNRLPGPRNLPQSAQRVRREREEEPGIE
jgi:S-adenosylmethionine hydrolase